MKKLFILTLLQLAFTLPLSSAQASTAPNSTPQKGNYLVTSNYYQQLITDGNRTAELSLLMNMLPKGGDLHHHYSGALYAETYLDWVEKKKYCISKTTFKIETKTPLSGTDCLSAEQIKKEDDLYRKLLSVWSDKDFYNHSHDQAPPDKQFFDTFGYFGPISNAFVREGLQLLKERAKAENLQYLETLLSGAPVGTNSALAADLDRLPPNADADITNSELAKAEAALSVDQTTQSMVQHYRQNIADTAQGMDDKDFTLRFQTYVSRNNKPSVTFANLYAGFAAAHSNPLIVGLNIVGPENGIVAMRDYALHMRMIRFLKQKFPDVHLALHAGELVLGMVPPEGLRNHIRLAVELAGADRIGHGVDISHETSPDTLLNEMKQRNIAVEINLTSNQFILGLSGAAHPLSLYRKYSVPFVIATDDEGVSRSDISNEYLLFVSRYKPSYDELKQVVYNSIRYSFLSPADKKQQQQLLEQRFSLFEGRVATLLHSENKRPAARPLSSQAVQHRRGKISVAIPKAGQGL